MTATKSDEEDAGESASAALFQNVDDISLADGFKDKVAALHEHFDRDRDGFLNHSELRGLQLLTSGNDMPPAQYLMACTGIGCDPKKGLSVGDLKLVYASGGADIEEDYSKVLGKKQTIKKEKKSSGVDDDDDVLEVGEDGVDISK